MYNQDGFFFFLSVKGGLSRVSRCLWGGVSPHHCLAPPHPAQWDQGAHGGERDHKCEAVLGVGWGWSHPP